MSYILITACDQKRNLQQLDIKIKTHFKQDYYRDYKKWSKFMDELSAKFEAVANEYFDDYEQDIVSNHEYNQQMNNH